MDSNPREASGQLPPLDPRSGKGNSNNPSVVASGGRTKATVHICQICERGFARLYNLKVHMRKHSGEMPYECPMANCTDRFKWRSSMAHHVRARHNGTNADILRSSNKTQENARADGELRQELRRKGFLGRVPNPEVGKSVATLPQNIPIPKIRQPRKVSGQNGRKGAAEKKRGNAAIYLVAGDDKADSQNGCLLQPVPTTPDQGGRKRHKRSPTAPSAGDSDGMVRVTKGSDLDELFESVEEFSYFDIAFKPPSLEMWHGWDIGGDVPMGAWYAGESMNGRDDSAFDTSGPIEFEELNEKLEVLGSAQARPFLVWRDSRKEINAGTPMPVVSNYSNMCSVDLDDSGAPDLLRGSTVVGSDVRAASGRVANESTGTRPHGDVPGPRVKDIEAAKSHSDIGETAIDAGGCNAADEGDWVGPLVGELEEGKTSAQTSPKSPVMGGSGCEKGGDAEDISQSLDGVMSRWACGSDDTMAADSWLTAFPAELAVFQPSLFGETQISTDQDIFTDHGPEQQPEFFDPLF